MPLSASDLDWIRQAQASLGEARRLLLSPTPESLEESAPHLKSAAGALEALEGALHLGGGSPKQVLLPELSHLRRQLSAVHGLLGQAGGFYLGWARLLAGTDGYTAEGRQTPAPPAPRISLEG